MNTFSAPNALSDQHYGNGNVADPQANYNFDGSAPHSFATHNGTIHADGAYPNNSLQNQLLQAYQQLNLATVGRQEAVTQYQNLVVKNEAQVSALRDQIDSLKAQIDSLKDELRTAQADAETAREAARVTSTLYIIFYPSSEHLLMFCVDFHKVLECHQHLVLLHPVIRYHMSISLKVPNSQLTDPRSTPKKYIGCSPMPRPTMLFSRLPTPTDPAHQWKKHFAPKTAR